MTLGDREAVLELAEALLEAAMTLLLRWGGEEPAEELVTWPRRGFFEPTPALDDRPGLID